MPTVDNTQKTGDKRATLLQANKRKTINLIAKKVEEKKSVDLKIPIVKPAEPQRSEKRRSSSPVAAVEILKKTKAEPAKSRIAPVIVSFKIVT